MCCVLFYLIFNIVLTVVVCYSGSVFPSQKCPPGFPECIEYNSASSYHSFHDNYNPEKIITTYRSPVYKRSASFHHSPHYHQKHHFCQPHINYPKHFYHRTHFHCRYPYHHHYHSHHKVDNTRHGESTNYQYHRRHTCFPHHHSYPQIKPPPFTITTIPVPITTANPTSPPMITAMPTKYIPSISTIKQENQDVSGPPTNQDYILSRTTEDFRKSSTNTENIRNPEESSFSRTTVPQIQNITELPTYSNTTKPYTQSTTNINSSTTTKTVTELNLLSTTGVARQNLGNVKVEHQPSTTNTYESTTETILLPYSLSTTKVASQENFNFTNIYQAITNNTSGTTTTTKTELNEQLPTIGASQQHHDATNEYQPITTNASETTGKSKIEFNLQTTTMKANQKVHNVTNGHQSLTSNSSDIKSQLEMSNIAPVNEMDSEDNNSTTNNATQTEATKFIDNTIETKLQSTSSIEDDTDSPTTETPKDNPFFDELYCDVKNLDGKAELFYNNKTYNALSDSNYAISIPLEGYDESTFEIAIKHRVLSIATWNSEKTKDHFEIIVIPTIVDTKQANWLYSKDILEIYFSIKYREDSCAVDINESVRKVNRAFKPITY